MSETSNDPRAERLKAALRENLKRRKAQIRGRASGAPASLDEPARLPEEAVPASGEEPPQEDGTHGLVGPYSKNNHD